MKIHRLAIGARLVLPPDFVTQSCAIVAKKRVGKSFTARRIVEELLAAGLQVIIIDPKGDWWGIRSSADGKGEGYPVTIFGGEHGDVPLQVGDGELIARVAVEENASMLLDLSELRKGEVSTFASAFLETLYRLKAKEVYRTPVMLVVDEGDAIAPQKPMPDQFRMLGAAEDIVRRGGQRGIGSMFITQRSAVLNKNVLTQAQVLVALRTIAPQDLAALKEWIDVHGDVENRKVLMESLPSLPVGDAWFWSPGWPDEGGIFARTHVLPIRTFDSGATPKAGEKRVEPKLLAPVDIDRMRDLMAEAVAKKESEDPRYLRARISELEKQLGNLRVALDKANASKAPAPLPFDEQSYTELHEKVFAEIGAIGKRVADAQNGIGRLLNGYRGRQLRIHAEERPPVKLAVQIREVEHRDVKPADLLDVGAQKIGRCPGEILKAISSRHPKVTSMIQAAILSGYSVTSSTFQNGVSALRTGGYIEGRGAELRMTQAGLQVAPPGARASLEDSIATWASKLGKCPRTLLAEVYSAHPRELSRERLSELAGYSLTSSTFQNGLSSLRTLGLIHSDHGGPVRFNPEILV